MIRNLKTLGLTLVAVVALGAMSVATASAETTVLTGGPSILGHDNTGEGVKTELTGVAGVKCSGATYPGTAEGSTITVGLQFSGCNAGERPVTVTDNKCHYNLQLGPLSGMTASATVSLVCATEGAGTGVEVDIYTDAGHTERWCRVEIPAQASLPNNVAVTDLTNGHLQVKGTVTGITNYLAPGGTDPAGNCIPVTSQVPNAALHLDMTVTGGVGLETGGE